MTHGQLSHLLKHWTQISNQSSEIVKIVWPGTTRAVKFGIQKNAQICTSHDYI